ncbi:MAG TPA: hypothetical protein V6C57_15990 [Coleofasciculaceae cyanobacterium]
MIRTINAEARADGWGDRHPAQSFALRRQGQNCLALPHVLQALSNRTSQGDSIMSLLSRNLLIGTAVTLVACLEIAQAALAHPVKPGYAARVSPTSAANTSTLNSVPLADSIVHGRITDIDADQVQIRRRDGAVVSYMIPEFDQRRYSLAVGSDVALTVRAANNTVVAIDNQSQAFDSGKNEPPLADSIVHGHITRIDADQVQIRRRDGAVVSYMIPEFDQRRYSLAVGSDVALTVRAANNIVVAIDNQSFN